MFRVKWKQTALDELAAWWTQADSALRARITQAADAIDQRLVQDPFASSESRSGRRRIDILLPLAVSFEVNAKTSTVTVTHVNIVRSRKK
jgi:hypothetical protein